jgi:hypothetical protein
MRCAGHVRIVEKRNVFRWVGNIKMDLVEMVLGDVDWIVLAQVRYSWRALVNAVMNFGVP